MDGNPLSITGKTTLTFRLGTHSYTQLFYISKHISQSVILGRDFLIENQVVIRFDDHCIEINNETISLEEDNYMMSLVKLTNTIVIPPQSSMLCYARARNNQRIDTSESYLVSAINTGSIADEPGLTITNCVVKLGQTNKFPINIVNFTNKHYKLKKGYMIGKIEPIAKIQTLRSSLLTDDETSTDVESPSFDHLTPEQDKALSDLINRNRDLFAATDKDLGRTNLVEMNIELTDPNPIKLPPYRIPLNKRHIIDKAVDELLDAKIIRPSNSPYSFPVVLINKAKDNSVRFCIDYRRLNSITKKISYPLEHIDDILASLGQCKYFSSLDLKSGYYQIGMAEQDKEKTAFVSHRGLFEFNVLSFGLCNGPAKFSQLMSIVLNGIKNEYAIAYLDDVIVFSKTFDEHLIHLQDVLDRLRKANLRLKLAKCSFLKPELLYLGHIVNADGIKPNPEKVEVMRKMQPPTNVKGVRSFIGMTSYYRRFIPNYSQTADPLIKLTRKYATFEWTDECQKAFETLKLSLITPPTLAYPDMSKPFILYTDASDTCIGAVLTQVQDDIEKPIHYLSHKLSKTQCNYPIIQKEMYSIVYALNKLDHYLNGSEFVIKTDHKPLKYLFSAPMKNKRIQLWSIVISGYNCTIEYVQGVKNERADLLSRYVAPVINPSISVINSDVTQLPTSNFPDKQTTFQPPRIIPDTDFDMVSEQEKDPDLLTLKTSVLDKTAKPSILKNHVVLDKILYYISDDQLEPSLRIFIPSHLCSLLLTQYHDDKCHLGIDKTYAAIREKYYWKNLFQSVIDHVNSCVPCRTRSIKADKPPTQNTDIPYHAFQKIAIDTSGPFTTTHSGNKYIVTIVCLLTNWPEAYPVPDKSAECVAEILLNHIIPRFSCPSQILSDNGTEYTSKL